MKTVHTGVNGKHASAVYRVHAPVTDITMDDLVLKLEKKAFPRSYRVNVTIFGITATPDGVEFYVMVINKKQTTRADLVNGLRVRLNWPELDAETVTGAPGLGQKVRKSASSRRGTKRALKNAPRGKAKAAR